MSEETKTVATEKTDTGTVSSDTTQTTQADSTTTTGDTGKTADATKTAETQTNETETAKAEDGKAKDGKTADAKANEEKKDGDKSGDEKPVEYSDFKLPEGMQANKEVLDQAVGFAKELKLPQDQAQKIVDMGVKLIADSQKAIDENWKSQRAKWQAEIKADKEIGGANFDTTHELVQRALRKHGNDPALKPFIDAGTFEAPPVVRFLRRIGLDISEDTVETGNAGASKSDYSTNNLHPELDKK